MAWLAKVRSAISSAVLNARVPCGRKKSNVGILAFEVANLMSKLIHVWRSLSDDQVVCLCDDSIALEGVRKVVSNDETFLLALACAELAETLRATAESIAAVVAPRCVDQGLSEFHESFKEFVKNGRDSRRWALNSKEMEIKVKRMEKYVRETAALYKEMEQLAESEQSLRKIAAADKLLTAAEAQEKVLWRKHQVQILKQSSLWSSSFDAAGLLLARSCFTTFSRLKQVFNLGTDHPPPTPLPRSVSFSAAVYPSPPQQPRFSSGPLEIESTNKEEKQYSVLEMSKLILGPPSSTLGAAALALQYANVVMVLEKMVRTPGAVGPDARDDLYAMLPASVKGRLRERLKGVGPASPAAMDIKLAAEWKAAVGCLVGWLGPLAQNTIRWQVERSFDQRRRRTAAAGNVLLVQTLVFADRDKVEDAVTELLVGLNYLWRFEREMCAMARAAIAAASAQQEQVDINRIQFHTPPATSIVVRNEN